MHKLSDGFSYAFNDLLGDIGKWFLAGVLIAGIISAFVPGQFIETHLGEGFLPMLVMLIVGIPMYVCATATTPIAAALAFKGLSPGAALVFLLAGPATNVASLTVITKILGKKATVVYLASIAVCSLAMGIAANYLYASLGISVTGWVHKSSVHDHGILSNLFPLILLALIIYTLLRQHLFQKPVCECGPDHDHQHDHGHSQ